MKSYLTIIKPRLSLLTSTCLLGLSLLVNSTAYADQLPSFTAVYDVRIMGFKIGQAEQAMSCQASNCTITSEAKPSGWASRFVNESAIEKVQIQQTDDAFEWLKYTKYLTRKEDGRTTKKTYTLIKNQDNDIIQYLEEKRQWKAQAHIYDTTSMAYGIQYRVLNGLPIDELFFQDEKVQQKLNFTHQNIEEEIVIPFDDEAQTLFFAFHNGKIDVKLWLMPELNYFPVRLSILNKDEDRKIELELNRKPTLQ